MPTEGFPPNYRPAACCRACRSSRIKDTVEGEKVFCRKYEDRFGYAQEVSDAGICDDYHHEASKI